MGGIGTILAVIYSSRLAIRTLKENKKQFFYTTRVSVYDMVSTIQELESWKVGEANCLADIYTEIIFEQVKKDEFDVSSVWFDDNNHFKNELKWVIPEVIARIAEIKLMRREIIGAFSGLKVKSDISKLLTSYQQILINVKYELRTLPEYDLKKSLGNLYDPQNGAGSIQKQIIPALKADLEVLKKFDYEKTLSDISKSMK